MTEAFVIASRDLDVVDDDTGIRFRIPAGTMRREDDETVRLHPELFYAEVTTRVRVELTQIALDNGRQLGVMERDYEITGAPPPDDPTLALREMEAYWERELGRDGSLLSLYGQRSAENGWIIRGEVLRDAPAPAQINVSVPTQPVPDVTVSVNGDLPEIGATVAFMRDSDGKLIGALVSGQDCDASVTFDRDQDGRIQSALIIEAS